jgi:ubiquinone/menaquinone biosynthesis C-methylase UbiE
MTLHVDALTSATLKNLREQWWNEDFSTFLQETLRPRPGNRILDVGCGEGTAEMSLGRLRISQLSLVAIDRNIDRVRHTAADARSHNYRVSLAAADAGWLPFRDGVFDATFCVAVLQHVNNVSRAVGELARVTRPGGRVLTVEPDNSARYWYSSSPAGERAFSLASRFFSAVSDARGDSTDPAVGPRLSALFTEHGIEPVSVQLFPVSVALIGQPLDSVWAARRQAVRRALERVEGDGVAALGREYLETLEEYERDAQRGGAHFVEIQNTMLFATVGQREE